MKEPMGKSSRLAHRLFSKCLKPCSHLIIREFAALGQFQYPHRLGYGGIPLVHADLLPVLFLLQSVVGAVVFHTGRIAVGLLPCLLAVGSYLPAGPLRFAGSDVVAVAGVVTGRQQKVGLAVVAAAGRVARGQSPVKLSPKESHQPVKGGFLRDKNFA